jgi:hypothetical protein
MALRRGLVRKHDFLTDILDSDIAAQPDWACALALRCWRPYWALG